MLTGKVLSLYMTMPSMMRAGHRMQCETIECDPDGIIGDMQYENPDATTMILTCQKSYDIIAEAELVVDSGVLMENIHVDIDLYSLQAGSIIEIGEVLLEVTGPCDLYGYLMALDPEIPELLRGNRGFFVRALEHGTLSLGDSVKVEKKV